MQKSTSGNDGDFIRQIVTLTAIIGAFVVNVVSNIFPLNGLRIGDISNTLFANVLIIPANYAFAIWGLIYLGLFALAIYQFLPNQRHDVDLRQIGYFLVIASVAQSIWVYLFLSRLFALSVIAMMLILIPLIAAYLRLGIGKQRVPQMKKWCVHFPISIYLGWISVATIVNVASWLYSQGWNGWGLSAELWTAMMLFVAFVIAAVIAIQRRDFAYTGVTIWALVAIALKQWNNSLLRNLALVLAIALLVIITIKSLQNERTAT
ncbi:MULTISPECIES: tryptophan-rich sensory protein [unclassified Nodularia (in: cyanobacteria)]|uniref:tryptophan-rich sensory protein n=1 Tax=unclassified Nodularia (in: cyanobacteria) TaxID=2656917 RepID=UPI00187EF5C4|nr:MULTISPECIES: tryptophan-rich sensory protein [unclassified Nodularia (in: cyanobacteria)]MBE9198947.1 tryptophan-rich sensory protein [Nodularia sp. LEGE 06071]MCC2692726.1 tryptophan-rich sensory protein [Nodularia sp. LEGE 04288]